MTLVSRFLFITLLWIASACSGSGPEENAVCGDGVVAGNELCDDGNTIDGDSCSADCSASDCLVPLAYPTIQAGVDEGVCDTLYVQSGTYTENVVIAGDIDIAGTGADDVIVDGGAMGSVFTIAGGVVSLRDLVLENGANANGGGIDNTGQLTLDRVTVRNNTASSQDRALGGGIYSTGSLTLFDSTIVDNSAVGVNVGEGGGIYALGELFEPTGVELHRTTVSGNRATALYASGGGISGQNVELIITDDSTVSQNSAEASSDIDNVVAVGGAIHLGTGSIAISDGSALEGNVVRAVSNRPRESASHRAVAAGGGINALLTFIDLTDGSRIDGNFVETESSGHAESTGGGIALADSTVTAVASSISGNTVSSITLDGMYADSEATASGGAVNYGTPNSFGSAFFTLLIDITDCVIDDNRVESSRARVDREAYAHGAGIQVFESHIDEQPLIRLTRTTASGNTAYSDGDARGGFALLVAAGESTEISFEVVDSTVANNRTESNYSDGESQGGMLYIVAGGQASSASARLVNSTISGNQAIAPNIGEGGAVYSGTGFDSLVRVSLANATVTQNQASYRGGALLLDQPLLGSPTVTDMRNSIIAGNSADMDPTCSLIGEARIESAGYNILGDLGSCIVEGDTTGDQIVDPALEPLQDNGGPTATHALAAGSPALDAGNPAGCTDDLGLALETDQRGQPRPVGGGCDIGAFEQQ